MGAQPAARSSILCRALAETGALNEAHAAQVCKGHLTVVADRETAKTQSVVFNDDTDVNASFSRHLLNVIPALNIFARRLCKHVDMAEDLVQEALMKAWAARFNYQVNTNFQAWIFTILRNHYFSSHRKRRCIVPWDSEVADHLLTCEPAQMGHLDLADLASALFKLPPHQQEALVLVGAGGCTYEEAAQITGCAVGTTKSRVMRGRKALHDYLATQHKSVRDCPLTGHEASAWILGELQRLALKSQRKSQTAFL